MLQDEQIYYNQLKNNRSINNFVFDKLFVIINGNTLPKDGVAFKLMPDGEPLVYDTFVYKSIIESLF